MAEEYDEAEDEEDEADINAVDGDDYEEEDWYEEEADEEYEEEVDEDQVAYVDDEGWFYVDEDTINAIDEQLTENDDEFAAILTTYTEARGALAKARIAHGFYPVVVPAEPSWGRPGRSAGKTRAASICFRCGKTGHLSANCTNAPSAKRSKPTDSADVIFDMTPWADEFAERRRNQSRNDERGPGLSSGPQQDETEDVNGLEETNGVVQLLILVQR